MPIRRQITCIAKQPGQAAWPSSLAKQPRHNPHERITHVGGGAGLVAWKLTVAEAIVRIERDGDQFYVSQPAGDTVDVVVATRDGHKYLKTRADGDAPKNLLSLPECV